MGGRDSRMQQALRAAEDYYLKNVTMEEISRELHTSRSTVSRLLDFARDAGLVEIRILPPTGYAEEIEGALESRYEVRAHVVHVENGATPVERHQRTAMHASRVLNSVFDSDKILALSWGTMLREISTVLAPKPVANCRVVQLNGIGHSRSVGQHYSIAILEAFANAYSAYIRYMAAPIFFDSEATRDALLAERSVKEVIRLQRDADIALFSLGTVEDGTPSAPYRSGYFLDDSDYASLRNDNVVGDLATTFIRADGTFEGIGMNRRTSGPDLTWFTDIPHRICAVSGDHKVTALTAALRGRLMTDLVVDESTARLLLDNDEPGPDVERTNES